MRLPGLVDLSLILILASGSKGDSCTTDVFFNESKEVWSIITHKHICLSHKWQFDPGERQRKNQYHWKQWRRELYPHDPRRRPYWNEPLPERGCKGPLQCSFFNKSVFITLVGILVKHLKSKFKKAEWQTNSFFFLDLRHVETGESNTSKCT